MKLFKKLAVVAVAAVLALSMVGCGNGSSVSSTKQLILNMLKDSASMAGDDAEIHNTAEMDSIAQKLLVEANAAYNDADQTDKSVDALMETAKTKAVAANAFKEDTDYEILYAEDYQFKSSFIPELYRQITFMEHLTDDTISVGSGVDLESTTKMDIGIATGKIGGKDYVVVVVTETPSAE